MRMSLVLVTFIQADLLSDAFWDELARGTQGKYGHLPLPDVVHASPPCSDYTRIKKMRPGAEGGNLRIVDQTIARLKAYETYLRVNHDRALPWEVENVPESEPHVREAVVQRARLCGTMFGHHVFRHRVFYCNYPATIELPHRHDGKYVGARGLRGSPAFNMERYGHLPVPNMYGVYSRPYAARGTAHEWHGALGFVPKTFSNTGLSAALPMGYGRLLSCQMVAHAMYWTYGMPVWPPGKSDELHAAALERWAEHGYQPLASIHCLADSPNALVAAKAEVDDDLVTEPAALEGEHVSPYLVRRADQLKDPALRFIIERLEKLNDVLIRGDGKRAADTTPAAGVPEGSTTPMSDADVEVPKKPVEAARKHPKKEDVTRSWVLHGGVLYWRDFTAMGELSRRVAVPSHLTSALLQQYHYATHRGHGPLYDSLRVSYYWPSMESDCLDFVRTCEVCQQRASQPMQKVPSKPVPTPLRPFSVIHVDHKGPLPTRRSGTKFNHIMVVTCALTRFTLLIPTETVTGDETLRLLVGRVFAIFGNPTVVVTDNGPAFRNELLRAASRFFGYRHVHVLPYNAQANGVAESAVKRIKLLLDRQTRGYRDWHKLLPMMQLMLNSVTHTATGVSPFCALFGREPTGLEQLENPALYPEGNGHQFLDELKSKLQHLWRELQEHSDAIKRARIDEANARQYSSLATTRHGVIRASTPDQPRFAWLIHGSREQAEYLRRHGHGVPWRHKYRVLEVKPHAARLEIPTDGSVPRVTEWQLLRRLSPAHPDSHAPGADAPVITESGVALPQHVAEPVVDGDLTEADDTVYDIERVSHAERVGNMYKIWIKWRNYDKLSWEWRHDLVAQSCNAELLSEIEAAVARERERLSATRALDAEVEEPPPVATPGAMGEQDGEPLTDARSLRVQRRRAMLDSVPQLSLIDGTSDPAPLIVDYRALAHGHLFFVEGVECG